MPKYLNTKMLNYQNAKIHECPNIQMSTYTTCQSTSSKTIKNSTKKELKWERRLKPFGIRKLHRPKATLPAFNIEPKRASLGVPILFKKAFFKQKCR